MNSNYIYSYYFHRESSFFRTFITDRKKIDETAAILNIIIFSFFQTKVILLSHWIIYTLFHAQFFYIFVGVNLIGIILGQDPRMRLLRNIHTNEPDSINNFCIVFEEHEIDRRHRVR